MQASYALLTAARNEAGLIEQTLRSVVRQTILPVRWLVVSDGSTDGTDELVDGYARAHPWIELLRLETGPGRNFARKARALNAGHARLRDASYDILGVLDADVSFEPDHFEFLLQKFIDASDLGVAGTPILDGGAHYDYRFTSISFVSGACQLFRRECFEEIGGFVPLERGGIDWIAVTTARMNGWRTRTFVEKVSVHHRRMGSSSARSIPDLWFQRGQKDYALGFHPLWEIARSIYQLASRPYLICGTMLLAGYTYGLVRRAPRPVSAQLVYFNRREQKLRLKQAAQRFLWPLQRPPAALVEDRFSLATSIARLQAWVEARDYKGYEPFDGLSSPARALTFGNHRLEQTLLQIGRQSPVNFRPLLGIKPLESTKGRGYMAWGYLARLAELGDEQSRAKAVACLEWLMQNKSPLYPEYSWGNHFDYVSRAGMIAKDESIIVWTALIGQVFLDAYDLLRDDRYLGVARGICSWIAKLPRETTPTGTCLSYLAARQVSIHNSNLLGAAMLARTAKHIGTAEWRDLARDALKYSCSSQLPEGAWYYGDDPRYRWVDCFHTGYNLDSIKCYVDSTGDETFRPHLNRGLQYFKATFIEPSGRPKYYHNRTYPIDIQCAAQAIETLAKFSDDDAEALPAALSVARWTVDHMQDPSGYFYYRRYPLLTTRIPMLHWGQATMYRALALLSLQRKRHARRPR